MALRKQKAGIASVSVPVTVRDTTSTTGAGLSGLVYNTAGLVAEYRRQGQSTWTVISLVAGTLGTWTSGGWIADGSLGGRYELGIPDAALAAGARWVRVRIYGAANMLPVEIEIELDTIDYQVAGGVLPGNLVQIDGLTTLDGAAVFGLKQLNINNTGGTAIVAKSFGGNGHGIDAAGNGSGAGIHSDGGATGHGIHARGGTGSGGSGLKAEARGVGNGIYALGLGDGGTGIVGQGVAPDGWGIDGTSQTGARGWSFLSGITSLANWLRALVRKAVPDDGTAQTEINIDSGYGVGTYDLTDDSQEALRDLLPADPADASDIAASFAAVNATLARILGISQDNWVMDDTTYVDGNLTAATIYIYDSAAHVTLHDKSTGLLYKWTLAGTFSGTNLTLAKQIRTL